jgi:hypothetical protein
MTLPELESLVRRFEDCTLPREEWTHPAHLSVAIWYLSYFSREEATERIRAGIQRYNASLGNTTGYHETITLSWVAIAAAFLREASPAKTVAELATETVARFGESDYLLRHFSKERLFSEAARRDWVEPDLNPLC